MSAIGVRIRDTRKRAKLTQQQLADWCGVSRAAVAQWENGTTNPATERVVKAAAALGVDSGYLLGSNYAVDPDSHEPIVGGRQLAIVDFVQATAMPELAARLSGSEILIADKPMSQGCFALIVKDRSMSPDFEVGDRVIVDPEVKPDPGDFVVAHVFADQEAVLRKCRPRNAQQSGQPEYELVPLNPDWPTEYINAQSPGKVIGTVVERRRYRSE